MSHRSHPNWFEYQRRDAMLRTRARGLPRCCQLLLCAIGVSATGKSVKVIGTVGVSLTRFTDKSGPTVCKRGSKRNVICADCRRGRGWLPSNENLRGREALILRVRGHAGIAKTKVIHGISRKIIGDERWHWT